jgi:glycosyltransferase involved in cell wall biosynthesis
MSFVRENIAHNYCSQYGSALGKPIAALHFYALRRLDHVVVVSKAIESDLVGRRFPPPKITHVKNWIDLKWMGDAARRVLGEKRGRAVLRVGSIGRLIPLKRVDWIIRAVGDLERRYPKLGIRLDIVGDGPSRSELENLVDELALRAIVTFHGHVYDVASVMRELDLVVLASESEGIPRVLMEAMSIGITCVGPRIGGIDELIIDNVTGYLFDATSYDHLVKTLGSVLCDRRFIEPSTITEHVRNNCDAYTAARRLMSLYSSLKTVNCQ